MTHEETALACACIAAGFLLGAIAGLLIAKPVLESLNSRISALECGVTAEKNV